jgi:hypothetical protein
MLHVVMGFYNHNRFKSAENYCKHVEMEAQTAVETCLRIKTLSFVKRGQYYSVKLRKELLIPDYLLEVSNVKAFSGKVQ